MTEQQVQPLHPQQIRVTNVYDAAFDSYLVQFDFLKEAGGIHHVLIIKPEPGLKGIDAIISALHKLKREIEK